MKDYIWKSSERVMTALELNEFSHNMFYIPETEVEKLCQTNSFAKNPKEYEGIKGKIKRVTKKVTDYESTGLVVEQGAEHIVPFYYLYSQVCGTGPQLVAYKSVALNDGAFSFVRGSEDANLKLQEWNKQIRRYFDRDEYDFKEEDFKKITFNVEIEDTIYVGRTIDITITENMTLAEFSDTLQKVLGVIPVVVHQKKIVTEHDALLKDIGIHGTGIVKLIPESILYDARGFIQQQLNFDKETFMLVKYAKRPWAYINEEEVRLSNINNLPPIWKSVWQNIISKFVLKLVEFSSSL